MSITVSSATASARTLSSMSDMGYSDRGKLFRDSSGALFVIIETKAEDYSPAYVGTDYIDEDLTPDWPLTLEPASTVVTISNAE